jgi:hypothetical protein
VSTRACAIKRPRRDVIPRAASVSTNDYHSSIRSCRTHFACLRFLSAVLRHPSCLFHFVVVINSIPALQPIPFAYPSKMSSLQPTIHDRFRVCLSPPNDASVVGLESDNSIREFFRVMCVLGHRRIVGSCRSRRVVPLYHISPPASDSRSHRTISII